MFAPGKLNRQKVLFEYILSSYSSVETNIIIQSSVYGGIILLSKYTYECDAIYWISVKYLVFT